ncbi:hypothetical protein DJ73_07250 [Halorubrum sp. Ea1]|uniref:hypothetical protein n=1 Tax=Halorubrum sp. Ea1 TaxID=1480718 RepID=UPI000B99A684|nr:hypothetical protein [Halorubrum sp. Ea1]OYR53598.1 hypothetical protein DJ73_07250 [Halorubrum sp. Ea1]
MSFETSAELSLTVDEGDLKNVQQQIEDGIGTTAVGVTDGGSMSAQSAGSSGGGRGRRARRSMRLAETRTELLEDAVVYLEDIEDKVGGGDGGGAGGIFTELLGSATETAGDAAIEAGDTVAETLTNVLTGTAASALGNTISSAITNSDVSVSSDIAKPEWAPLTVRKPGWKIEVEDPTNGTDGPIGGPVPVPDIPPLSVPELPSIDAPDSIAVNRDPLPVEDTTLPVQDVGPITVSLDTRSGSNRGGGGSRRGLLQRTGSALDDAGARGADMLLPGSPPASVTKRLGEGGTPVGRPFEALGRGFDTVNPFTSGGFGSGNRPSGTGGGQMDVSVTHSPTYRVDVDPRRLDRLADRIVTEIEENVERDIVDLEREINDLRSNLDELEREITN